jgi:hypothetical protein
MPPISAACLSLIRVRHPRGRGSAGAGRRRGAEPLSTGCGAVVAVETSGAVGSGMALLPVRGAGTSGRLPAADNWRLAGLA